MTANESVVTISGGDVLTGGKSVGFNDVREYFVYEKVPTCYMLVQERYAEILNYREDRHISKLERLTSCQTYFLDDVMIRNKRGELCFVVRIEGHREQDLERFKKLMFERFPNILYTSL